MTVPEPAAPPRFPACVETGAHSRERTEWLAARRKGLGGSDVGAILGLHPYRSALEVYADKVGANVDVANDDGIPENEAALWGTVFEEPILREFARRAKREVRHAGELLRSRTAPWMTVTLDGEQLTGAPRWSDGGPGPAEIKTTGYGAQWHERIPEYVLAQVQQQLFVTGATWATLVWLPFPERKLQWFEIAPHAEFQALIEDRCAAFWARVLERRPPDADGSDSARRALHALDPTVEDETVALNAEAEEIADELEAINAALKTLDDRKRLIGNRVIQTLAGVKVGLLPSGRYWSRWTTEPRESLCAKCGTVQSTTKGSSASRLFQPRKKPHGLPLEARTLRLDHDPELAALLGASLANARRAG